MEGLGLRVEGLRVGAGIPKLRVEGLGIVIRVLCQTQPFTLSSLQSKRGDVECS